MQAILKDLLSLPGVRGALILSPGGKPMHVAIEGAGRPGGKVDDWLKLLAPLKTARVAELLFESGRVFLRRASEGTLMVLAHPDAPGDLIRLHCDILLSKLSAPKPSKGFRRFFRL